jgi:hypothetical protein
LRAAIMAGAVERVRPKMMTVIAIIAGLLPILWSYGWLRADCVARACAPAHFFLSSPGSSPVQQQMREDYRTQLQGAQRDFQQSNPSDLSREQQQIGQQLNNYSNMGPR